MIYFSVAVGNYWSLKVDWITGNLYVVTDGGYIIVCDGRSRDTGAIGCSWIARDQGELRGITLRPDKGYFECYLFNLIPLLHVRVKLKLYSTVQDYVLDAAFGLHSPRWHGWFKREDPH